MIRCFMSEKIVNFIAANKDLDGQMLPIEKEMIIKSLGGIPHDIAKEYSDAFGAYIEDQLILKNIISSSDRSHLVRYLVDGLSETQLTRLSTIITHLTSDACEKKIKEIINATLGISLPTESSKMKASELVDLVKVLNINHEEKAKELADIGRLIRIFCDLLVVCRMGDHVETYMRDRLSMIPESDLEWLLEIGAKRLISNN